MHIKKLELKSFGSRSGLILDDFSAGVNVIYGPNEAGKTTILEAVRVALFGFLDGRSKRNKYESPDGKDRHIYVELAHNDDQIWKLNRIDGQKDMVIVDNNHQNVPVSSFAEALHYIDRDLYEKLFAFSLKELADFSSLDADAVQDRLLGTALGAGAVSPAHALKIIKEKKNVIYKPQARTKSIVVKTRKENDEIASKISKLRTLPQEYDDLIRELADIKQERKKIREEKNNVDQGLHSLSRLLEKRNEWDILQAAKNERKEYIHAIKMPVDAFTKLKNITKEKDRSQQKLDDHQRVLEELKLKTAGIKINPNADSWLGDLDIYVSRSMREKQFDRDLRGRQEAEENAVRDAEQKRISCGAEWTSMLVREVSPDRALKQQILTRIEYLRDMEQKEKQATVRLDDAKSAYSGKQLRLEELKEEIAHFAHLTDISLDFVSQVAKREIQLEGLKKEIEGVQNDAERYSQSAVKIEVYSDLVQIRPTLEAIRGRLTVGYELTEQIAISQEKIKEQKKQLDATLLQCENNATETEILRIGQNDQLNRQLSHWQETWTGVKTVLSASESRLSDLKEQVNNKNMRLQLDYEELRQDFDDKLMQPAILETVLQHQKKSFRDYEKSFYILGRRVTEFTKLKQKYNRTKQDLKTSLEGLGQGWQEKHLRKISLNLKTQQNIQEMSAAIQAEENDLRRLSEEFDAQKANFNLLQKKYDHEVSEVDNRNDTSEQPSAERMGKLRVWLSNRKDIGAIDNDISRTRRFLEEVTVESEGNSKVPYMLKAVAGATTLLTVGGAAYFFLNDYELIGIISSVTGVLLISVLVAVLKAMQKIELEALTKKEGKESAFRADLESHKEGLARLQKKLANIASELPDSYTTTEETAEDILTELEMIMTKYMAGQTQIARLQRLTDHIDLEKENLTLKKNTITQKSEQLQSQRKEWKKYLSTFDAPFPEQSGHVVALFSVLMDLRLILQNKQNLWEDLQNKEKSISETEKILQQLAEKNKLTGSADDDGQQYILSKWEVRNGRLEDLRYSVSQVNLLEIDQGDANKKVEIEQVRFKNLKMEWKRWLENEGISATETPVEVQRLIERFRIAYDFMMKVEQLEEITRKDEERLLNLIEKACDSGGLDSKKGFDINELSAQVEEKYQRSLRAEEKYRKREKLLANGKEASQKADELSKQLQQEEQKTNQSVKEKGFDSTAEFLKSKDKLDQYNELKREIRRVEPELKSLARQVEVLQKNVAIEKGDQNIAKDKLQEVLNQHHIPVDANPNTLPDLIDSLLDYHKTIGILEESKAANQRIKIRWEKMTSEYTGLLNVFDYPVKFETMEPEDVVSNIQFAIQKLKEEKQKRGDLEQVKRSQKMAAKLFEQAKIETEEREKALTALLDMAGATDLDTFKKWIDDAERLRIIQATITEKETILKTVLGIANRTELYEYLEKVVWLEKQSEFSQLEDFHQSLEANLGELDNRIGAINNTKQDYEQKEELAELRQARSSGVARLESAFTEWMEWEVASSLISMARDRFEKERQPKVLKNASQYFKILTGGAWKEIRNRLGENNMEAVRKNGNLVPLINLSSGTVEPLYFAMRLALISDYANTPIGAPPVLMDDILVNFDDHRTTNAVSAINTIGNEVQVILLTCHRRIVNDFRNNSTDVKIHELVKEN